jgi:hypothetical protein
MDEDPDKPTPPALMLQREIENAIYRYSQEADLSRYEAIGVIEICKENLLQKMRDEKKRLEGK